MPADLLPERWLVGFTWKYNRVCEPRTAAQELYYMGSDAAYLILSCDGVEYIHSPLTSFGLDFQKCNPRLPLRKVRIALPIWAEPVLEIRDD